MAKELAALSKKEARFCQEILIDLDPFAAAKRAGYPYANNGLDLLTRASVRAEIALLRTRRASRLELKADDVLSQWWMVATADPNEVVQLRRVNCRYCHGINYGYQRTAGEMEEALEIHAVAADKARNKGRETVPFDQKGGDGYAPWGTPNENCPECGGEGEPKVYLHDSRNLTPAGRALYASVEQTKGGVKVNLKNQEAALLNVAKHLGMHIERKEVAGPGGEPLEIIVKVVRPGPLIEGDVTEAALITELDSA